MCLTCIAQNSTPSASQGCNCNTGFYGTKPLTSSNSCSACYSECATCTQANLCSTCISSYATPNSTQGCSCNTGYYGTKPLTSNSSCQACYSECSTCTQAIYLFDVYCT